MLEVAELEALPYRVASTRHWRISNVVREFRSDILYSLLRRSAISDGKPIKFVLTSELNAPSICAGSLVVGMKGLEN